MGFKVTYKEITIPEFNQVLSEIYKNQKFDDVKISYKIKRLVGHIETAQKNFYSLYSEIQEKYAVMKTVKDKDGKATSQKSIDPSKKEEFAGKVKELGDIKVDIPWYKLTISDLEGTRLSPIDLARIDAILDCSDDLALCEPSHT